MPAFKGQRFRIRVAGYRIGTLIGRVKITWCLFKLLIQTPFEMLIFIWLNRF